MMKVDSIGYDGNGRYLVVRYEGVDAVHRYDDVPLALGTSLNGHPDQSAAVAELVHGKFPLTTLPV